MKLIDHFNDFLKDVVNLNATRVTQLEDSIDAIEDFIRASDWQPRIRGFFPHGSWAHKTIIKPQSGLPVDADLMVYVDPVKGWEAKDYVNKLHGEFIASGTYKNKVQRFSHCVTITYAGERKIDIAPCIKGRTTADQWEVCNRNTNEFEGSAPKDYTEWLAKRNDWSGNNSLRKVTRLLKYLRDIKTRFTCPSFLLTTLLGNQVKNGDAFADVPTALKVLVGRLDDFLQANPAMPDLRNPVLWSEKLTGAWDEAKYKNFRDVWHRYRGWIDDAFDEESRDESIAKWRRVFGDDFAGDVVIKEAAEVSSRALVVSKGNVITADAAADLVEMVKVRGELALPPRFTRLPHMRRPTWPVSATTAIDPIVRASYYASVDGQRLRGISSLEPLPPRGWLRFEAFTHMGMPFGDDFEVHWRITNTDQAAARAQALRGDFYKSRTVGVRWEALEYRGVHMAEAFIIRKRNSYLLGNSKPFFVVIE
jgi:hypothetical protein